MRRHNNTEANSAQSAAPTPSRSGPCSDPPLGTWVANHHADISQTSANKASSASHRDLTGSREDFIGKSIMRPVRAVGDAICINGKARVFPDASNYRLLRASRPLDMVDKINGRQIAERTGCPGIYNKIGL